MAHRGRKNADDALLRALSCGATAENAAAMAGVSPRTVTRRLADSEFQKRLRTMRSDTVHRTMAAITAAGTEAVRTLLELMKSSTPSVRLGAVRTALEMGIKIRQDVDLEERLAALEERSPSKKPRGR